MFYKKKLFYLVLILIISAGSYFVWFNKPKGNSELLDQVENIFNIDIPTSFDQAQKDRLLAKIEESKKAYNEKKDENWTWVMIGNMYLYAQDYDRSILAFNKASEIEPKDITAILNLGNIYEDYKINYQEAEKYYSKAVVLFPSHADLYDRLAKLYWLKMNNPKDAEVIYLQGLDAADDKAALLLNLINFYGKTNQLDQQKIYIKKLLDAYPNNELYKKDFGNLVK